MQQLGAKIARDFKLLWSWARNSALEALEMSRKVGVRGTKSHAELLSEVYLPDVLIIQHVLCAA